MYFQTASLGPTVSFTGVSITIMPDPVKLKKAYRVEKTQDGEIWMFSLLNPFIISPDSVNHLTYESPTTMVSFTVLDMPHLWSTVPRNKVTWSSTIINSNNTALIDINISEFDSYYRRDEDILLAKIKQIWYSDSEDIVPKLPFKTKLFFSIWFKFNFTWSFCKLTRFHI